MSQPGRGDGDGSLDAVRGQAMVQHTGPGQAPEDEAPSGLAPDAATASPIDDRDLAGLAPRQAEHTDLNSPEHNLAGAEAAMSDTPGHEVADGVAAGPTPWSADAPVADDPPDLRGHDPSPEDLPPLLRPNGEAPRAEPEPSMAQTVPLAEPPRRRGGVGALLLGGVVAAALGFGAAWVARDRLAPGLDPTLDARLAALEQRAETSPADPAGALADLEARVAALEAEPDPGTEVDPEALAALRDEVTAAATRADTLDARVAALEAAPPPEAQASEPTVPEPAAVDTTALTDGIRTAVLAAVEPRLASLEQAQTGLGERIEATEGAVNAARAEDEQAGQALAAAEAEAAEAARRAEAEEALAALGAALDAGEPLAPALETLPEGQAVPEALTAVAEGAPTLAALREAFPEAARAGLAAAREAGLTQDGGGLGGFLRGQLSLRSTAPRTGDDPDAILSRAQAAIDQGRLAPALAEVGALPEPARLAMGEWTAQAQARADADAALASLRGAAPAPATTTD